MMEYHEIIDGLRGVRSWNNFAASLLAQYDAKGELSERQYDAAERMLGKCQRAAERKQAETVKVDLSRIELLLMTAKLSKLLHPKFRAEGMEFSLAGATSRNAGAVYVKRDGEYVGKVMDGTFHPVAATPEGTAAAIAKIAADPLAAAVTHGRLTGNCACCGRKLTDKRSVELGIGPICAERWGL